MAQDIASQTKRPHTRAMHKRRRAGNKSHSPVMPCISPRRKGKRRRIHTSKTTSHKKARWQRRYPSNELESDNSDDEMEIVVDSLRCLSKPKPQLQSKHKSHRTSPQHSVSSYP